MKILLAIFSMSRARRLLELALNQSKTDFNCNDSHTDTEVLDPLENGSIVADFGQQMQPLTTTQANLEFLHSENLTLAPIVLNINTDLDDIAEYIVPVNNQDNTSLIFAIQGTI